MYRINASAVHTASKNTLSDIELFHEFSMGVLGHGEVDTVLSLSSHMRGTPETSTYFNLAATVNSWREFAQTHYKPELHYQGTSDTWKDALWRTITANAADQFHSHNPVFVQVGSDGYLPQTFRKLN
jgi:hypothetical protein